jgi:peptide/nickel transport system ATP-binding protein
MRIGDQLMEAAARTGNSAALKSRAIGILEAVKIRDPERVFRAWPHELSGGMGQRVMIAMMLVTEPELLIADEPTSALDVTVRLQVLAILDDLVKTRDMGLIFISHDLNLVSTFCDRVLVMYAGQIMEELDAKRLNEAKHPYTRGLLACTPSLDKPVDVLPTLTRDPSWMAPVTR